MRKIISVFACAVLILGLVAIPKTTVLADGDDTPEFFTPKAGTASLLAGTPSSLTITGQPSDATVEYPAGAEFDVTVDDPSKVSSYQWWLWDGEQWFKLDGTSASTSHLVWTCTTQRSSWQDAFQFVCQITDTDGNKINSDPANLIITNGDVDLTVLYVLGYALLPGDTLDMSTITDSAGNGVGTGIVTFDANGVDITFDSLNLNNTYMETDSGLTSSPGILLVRYLNQQDEYRIHLIGENKVVNTVFDAEQNASGITLDLCCYGSDEARVDPLITIDGDGSLYLVGGTYAFRSFFGDVDIQADISTGVYEGHYSQGMVIEQGSLKLSPGVDIDLNTAASGIYIYNNFFSDSASISIETEAARTSVGATEYHGITFHGKGYILNSDISVNFNASPSVFSYYGSHSLVGVCGLQVLPLIRYTPQEVTIEDSTFDCCLSAEAAEGTDYYAFDFYGISCSHSTSIEFINSEAILDIAGEDITGARGIAAGSLTLKDGSYMDISNSVFRGSAIGADINDTLTVTDSSLAANVHTDGDSIPFGIVSDNAQISLSSGIYSVESGTEGGIAFACSGVDGDVFIDSIGGYVPSLIKLEGKTKCILPEENRIDKVFADGEYYETFFEKNTYDKAADSVIIEYDDPTEPVGPVDPDVPDKPDVPETGDSGNAWLYLMMLGTAGAVIILAVRRRARRRRKE